MAGKWSANQHGIWLALVFSLMYWETVGVTRARIGLLEQLALALEGWKTWELAGALIRKLDGRFTPEARWAVQADQFPHSSLSKITAYWPAYYQRLLVRYTRVTRHWTNQQYKLRTVFYDFRLNRNSEQIKWQYFIGQEADWQSSNFEEFKF